MHLDLRILLMEHVLKTKKEYKNYKKKQQEIEHIFIKINWIKLAFNMTRLMEILRIYLEEQLMIKYYVIKHLILLKIKNMKYINADLLHWFINYLIKSILVVALKVKLYQTKN